MSVKITTNQNTVAVADADKSLTIINNNEPSRVSIIQPESDVIYIAIPGPIGPQGAAGTNGANGAEGPQGIPGPAANTGSLLTTASVTLNTITFTKGNGSTFPITVNTGSAATINTSSFATTGSNEFNGNQAITGSLAITGSQAITGSLSTTEFFTTTINETSLENFSSTSNYAGTVINTRAIDGDVIPYDVVSLKEDGIWYQNAQENERSSKKLGIYLDNNLILTEGHIVIDDVGSLGPDVQGPQLGIPIFIRDGAGTYMSCNPPTSGYVRILGHIYYQNENTDPNLYIMRFNPSNDFYLLG